MSYLEDKFLSKWPIFSLLEETFLHSLKLVCVFGSSGNEALTVTCNDEVYALGSNVSGCLGIGDMTSTLEPRRVKELCYKGEFSTQEPLYWGCLSKVPRGIENHLV